MRNLKTILCFFAILSLANSIAFARLGETFEECTKRYGKCMQLDNQYFSYMKNDLKIQIHFKDDKADLISYEKPNQQAFSQSQLDYLLLVNAPKVNWQIIQSFPNPITNNPEAKYPLTLKSENGDYLARTVKEIQTSMNGKGFGFGGLIGSYIVIYKKSYEDNARRDAEILKALSEKKELDGL